MTRAPAPLTPLSCTGCSPSPLLKALSSLTPWQVPTSTPGHCHSPGHTLLQSVQLLGFPNGLCQVLASVPLNLRAPAQPAPPLLVPPSLRGSLKAMAQDTQPWTLGMQVAASTPGTGAVEAPPEP